RRTPRGHCRRVRHPPQGQHLRRETVGVRILDGKASVRLLFSSRGGRLRQEEYCEGFASVDSFFCFFPSSGESGTMRGPETHRRHRSQGQSMNEEERTAALLERLRAEDREALGELFMLYRERLT